MWFLTLQWYWNRKKTVRILERILNVSVLLLVQYPSLATLPIYLIVYLSKDLSTSQPFFLSICLISIFLSIFISADEKFWSKSHTVFYSKYIPIDVLYWLFYSILHWHTSSLKRWKTYSTTLITIHYVDYILK